MCGDVSAAEATLMAHMDTVLPLGSLAKKPFRVEGNKAYGRGIGHDKLKKTGYTGYREVTVLIGADEVISTPGTRGLIGRLAAEHDAVLHCEPSGPGGTSLVRPPPTPVAPSLPYEARPLIPALHPTMAAIP